MGKILVRRLMAGVIAIALGATSVTALGDDESISGDKGFDMLVDLVVMRPLGLVGTAVGAAAFVVALPFTAASGNVGESAHELVVKPAEYTFNRPLGDFHHCGSDRQPCGER